MYSAQDIRTITFDIERKGYSQTDVDSFLKKIASEYEAFQNEVAVMLSEKDAEIAAVKKEKEELEGKMLIIADRLEQYRKDENVIRNALINAEKLKDNVLSEAQQTSAILLKDAQQKAERIIEAANSKVEGEQEKFVKIQQEVVRFKHNLVELYKEHINLISALPDDEDVKYPEEETAAPAEETPVFADPVYADDIPDLTLDEEPAAEETVQVAEETVEPVAETVEEVLEDAVLAAAEVETEVEKTSGRFDFEDKFGF